MFRSASRRQATSGSRCSSRVDDSTSANFFECMSEGGVVSMLVREFDFHLPPELIAQEPAADRSEARLLHLPRAAGAIVHSRMAELPGLLRAGDVLVVNDTRVFPARLLGRRVPSGGAVECLLVARLDGRQDVASRS